MGLVSDLLGIVRGKNEPLLDQPGGSPSPLVVNPRGDLSVVQGLPPNAELVRMRSSYVAIAVTAVAPVVALPTTTAQLTLWNGENDGGKIYVIDSVIYYTTVSAAAATNVGLLCCMNVGKKTAPTGAITPKGLAGHAYRGSGLVAVGATITDDSWHPLGDSVIGAASQIGTTVEVPVDGLYIIPPGHMFSLAGVANTVTTITGRCGIRWHEVQLPVG